jgi:hypothetical protein
VVTAAPLEHDLKFFRKSIGVLLLILPAAAFPEMHVIVVEGLGGEPRYTEQFGEQVAAIESAALGLTGSKRIRVFPADEVSRDEVLKFFDQLKTGISGSDQS